MLLDLAYARALPIVATNEVYFASPDDYEAHDALLCIAGGTYVTEDNRRRLSRQHFFKTAEQMAELFADLPEALANTIEIAKRCAFRPAGRKPILPRFVAAAPGTSEEEQLALEAAELRAQAAAGLEAAPRHHAPGTGFTADDYAQAARLRDRRDLEDEVPGLLPDRRRLHQVGQVQRHPRGTGARLRRGLGGGLVAHDHRPRSAALRPAVRALPEPRAHLDAGLRHRFLPGPPRRGDPLRAEALRRRPRGADHHARQAAGPRRAARRGARAADAVRAGRQALQADPQQPGQPGDAGAGDRGRAQAAGGPRRRAGGGAAARDRTEARGALPARLHARRRHGHRRPPAQRAGPALSRSQVELPHHAVQLEAGGGGGARQVRLPRPQDADRAAEGRRPDQARPRHRGRPPARSRSTTARPSSCWPRPTRSACSSWKVPACARASSASSPTGSRTSWP